MQGGLTLSEQAWSLPSWGPEQRPPQGRLGTQPQEEVGCEEDSSRSSLLEVGPSAPQAERRGSRHSEPRGLYTIFSLGDHSQSSVCTHLWDLSKGTMSRLHLTCKSKDSDAYFTQDS